MKKLLLFVVACCGWCLAGAVARAETWTQSSAPTNDYEYFVTCSADGSKMAAAMYADNGPGNPGLIYLSTNAGATWTASSAPSNNWYGIASSTNGNKLVAVAQGGGIYITTNAGAVWTKTSAPNAV